MTEEMKKEIEEKLKACKTQEEKEQLLKSYADQLSDDDLDKLSGGTIFPGIDTVQMLSLRFC